MFSGHLSTWKNPGVEQPRSILGWGLGGAGVGFASLGGFFGRDFPRLSGVFKDGRDHLDPRCWMDRAGLEIIHCISSPVNRGFYHC